MNEEINSFVDNAAELIANFDDEPTEHNATLLESHLTIMKLMIGVDKFDELPHFRRYLDKATRFLNNIEQ